MALRNQPYIPLYVQDFLTDEKLIECSAQSTGVYIRLLCVMHKSEFYGKILLKQKDKQTTEQVKNFATKLAKQFPYTVDVIFDSLTELLNENVLQIEEDYLIQKRMVKDNNISEIRSLSGSKGGKKTTENTKNFAQAKVEAKHTANSEYEIEYENDIVIKKKSNKKEKKFIAPLQKDVIDYFIKNGYKESSAITAFNYYTEADWHDAKGNKVLNWKQKMISVWFKDEHKQQSTKQTTKPELYR